MKEKLRVPKLRFKEFSGEWEEKSLGELLNYTKGYAFKSENYSSTGIRIIRVSDLGAREVKKDNEKIFINKSDIEESILKKYEIKKENIIVTTVGSHPDLLDSAVGRGIFINEDGLGLLNQNMLKFENAINNNKFIFSYINTSKYISHIKAIKRGNANQANITVENLLEYKIFITSLPEQQKIANFLSVVDEKIEKLTKKKELLEQYKKGVMQKIFSQELRFKDDNGNDFPEWEEKELGEVNIEISDGNYGELYPKSDELKKEGIPFIRANNIKNLKLIWKDMKYIDEDLHKILTSGHLETGDILVTTRGDIGMIAYVSQEFDGANINAQICLLRIKNHSINNIYLLQYLSSKKVLSQFKALQTGSALKQLPKKNLEKVLLVLPSLLEQQKIADFLSVLDKKIDIVDKELGQVQEFKKGLLQQMFV